MKFSSLALLANLFPLATGFAPSANQRQLLCSNINSKINNSINNSINNNNGARSTTSSLDSTSMNIPAILSAGAISLGLLTFTGEEASASVSSMSASAPSVVVSVSVSAIDELDGILSSAQSPSALKEAEKKVAEEVKEAEKLAKKDAKVSYVMFHIICLDWIDGWI